MVDCPICGQPVKESLINAHIDSDCQSYIDALPPTANGQQHNQNSSASTQQISSNSAQGPVKSLSGFFQKPNTPKSQSFQGSAARPPSQPGSVRPNTGIKNGETDGPESSPSTDNTLKRSFDETSSDGQKEDHAPSNKRAKATAFEKAAPLAERMRPKHLDDVCGQELVGPSGILRGLIEQDRVPSMILWGGPGTGTNWYELFKGQYLKAP